MKTLGRFLLIVLLAAPAVSVSAKKEKKQAAPAQTEQTAKYVFFFIGDGMGANHVLGTQMYLAEKEGRVGNVPLCFTQFPYGGMVMTYSATSGVTDSAAGGTALATGTKTANETLGMGPDRKTNLKSIAYKAKEAGKKVAICTSARIDDATPGAFYANSPSRKQRHNIGMQLAESGFDFFAGGYFNDNFDTREPEKDKGCEAYAEEKGYVIARGIDDYKAKAATAKKMVLFEKKELHDSELKYAIDQTEEDITLPQLTTAAIDFLMKEPNDGFFMMVEGSNIDHASHGNDAGAMFREVVDLDSCVKIAYNFYLQHPDETLIVVSADHETGGLTMGFERYSLNLKALQYQDMSEDQFTTHLKELVAKCPEPPLTMDEVMEELKLHFGLGDKVRLSRTQEQQLQAAYIETFGMGIDVKEDAEKEEALYEYYKPDKISDTAVKVLNQAALVNWGAGAHSNGYVPVYAIGVGSEQFRGQINNIQIPEFILNVARY